jgi:hypothetical protein
MKTVSTKDLVAEAAARGITGFERGRKQPCCYSCRSCWPDLQNWRCTRHGLIFGSINSTEAYSHMMQFICADFTGDERENNNAG